ncbi:MAG: PDZ domain-containing protein, partial [Myxococcota bacterium]|nr:PDZ domain-containing protein [Myxococcota bacterium]
MSVTVIGVAVGVLLAATPVSEPGPAGTTSTRALQAEIKAMGPFTKEGAGRVVARMHQGLVKPPGEVEADARTICGRFLSRVVPKVVADPESPCGLKLDALEALAMCQYLAGAMSDARRTVVERLALTRCETPGQRGDGFSRAVALGERWLWADLVRPLLLARSGGAGSPGVVANDLTRRLRVGALKAFGDRPVRGGAVVAVVKTGSAAAGAGLRVGDVILTLGAKPVSSMKAMVAALGKSRKGTHLVYLRDGKRKEGVLRG